MKSYQNIKQSVYKHKKYGKKITNPTVSNFAYIIQEANSSIYKIGIVKSYNDIQESAKIILFLPVFGNLNDTFSEIEGRILAIDSKNITSLISIVTDCCMNN